MDRLSTGNLVRIKGMDGIWRISGISYEDGRERNYYFIREKRIRIGKELLERNGFVYGFNNDGLWRWVKLGDGWIMEYDMDNRIFVISDKGGKVCEGECEFVNDMQDKIKGSEYWGRVDIVIE